MSMTQNLQAELTAIEQEMAAAFNAGQVDKILGYFSPDILGFSSTTHNRIQGLEALRKTFEYYQQEGRQVEFSVRDVVVQDLGTSAVATFYWQVVIHHRDHVHQIPGRGTHVFTRTDAGWRIVHEHFSRAHHNE
jgi:ketosteroid isomerase-like protein